MKNIVSKLTSRKFWAAVTGVALSVLVICGTDSETQSQIIGLITAVATLVAYIVGEGLVDAAAVKKTTESEDKTNE